MPRKEGQSFYFQEIARVFFGLRGAPFVLSSRDMVTISSWEERGIPLRVVLEGMERAFEKYGKRAGGRKISSLFYCEPEILKAAAEFIDRRVGRPEKRESREDKRKRIRVGVERFLESLPPQAGFLGGVYREALAVLGRRVAPEDALERLDAKVEELITKEADAAFRAAVEKRVGADFAGRPPGELRRIAAIELVKQWRERYRVPYCSYFYY